MTTRKIMIISFLLLFLVIGGLLAFWFFGTQPFKDPELVTRTYALGESTIKGYVGVEITYDVKPENVQLMSSTDKTYDIKNVNEYIENSSGNSISMLVDTDELCKWTVSITTTPDAKIEYNFVNKPSPTLYIDNPRIIKSGMYYYVQFETVVNDPEETTGQCSVAIKTADKKFDIITSDIKINDTAYVRFEPPIEAFTNEQYIVSVVVETNKQIAKSEFDLKLTALEQPESTTTALATETTPDETTSDAA